MDQTTTHLSLYGGIGIGYGDFSGDEFAGKEENLTVASSETFHTRRMKLRVGHRFEWVSILFGLPRYAYV